jgi:hypothetical protein
MEPLLMEMQRGEKGANTACWMSKHKRRRNKKWCRKLILIVTGMKLEVQHNSAI